MLNTETAIQFYPHCQLLFSRKDMFFLAKGSSGLGQSRPKAWGVGVPGASHFDKWFRHRSVSRSPTQTALRQAKNRYRHLLTEVLDEVENRCCAWETSVRLSSTLLKFLFHLHGCSKNDRSDIFYCHMHNLLVSSLTLTQSGSYKNYCAEMPSLLSLKIFEFCTPLCSPNS